MRLKRLLPIALLIALVLTGCAREQQPFEGIPNPSATVEMSDGSVMRFELFLREAPNTVANFVELANDGFYDGQRIFRIVPGVLVQSGDPLNSGRGGARHRIQGEFAENGIENIVSHTRGTISMARQSELDSASSQFFVMQGSYPEYDGHYAAFGRATDAESLKTLDQLASTAVDGSFAPVGVVPRIERIRVETYGYKYEAAKLDPPDETTKQN